jgi:hypothetical protein
MQPPKPLPLPAQPIAAGIAPTQPYAEYFKSADTALRALVASPPNAQTVNYTLSLSDQAGTVYSNQAVANTLTVPPNSGAGGVPFPIGTVIRVIQIGAGQTTLTPGAGVTLVARIGLKLAGQYAVGFLYKVSVNTWVAYGDLAP